MHGIFHLRLSFSFDTLRISEAKCALSNQEGTEPRNGIFRLSRRELLFPSVDFHGFVFGELRRNDQRTVVIQTRCTQNYKVQLTSQNSGSLVLEDGDESGTSRVGYSAFFDGQSVNFAANRSIQYSAADFYENHKLMIQVGDISNKRAGLYKDVIVIRIMSAI